MPVTIDGTTGISGNGSGLTDLNASNLSTGTVPDARFPATLPAASGVNLTALNASNLGSGTVPDARFPATLPAVSGANLTALNASNLGSGTVPDARFPATLPAASGVNLTALNASNLGSGTVPDARFPATLPAASGANLTNLNASNLSSGTVATARLGSGTANNTTFLRGDGTWAAAGGAASEAYAVGTYVIAGKSTSGGSNTNANETVSGSSLRIASVNNTTSQSHSFLAFSFTQVATQTYPGTWRAMQSIGNGGTINPDFGPNMGTLWQRIS